MAIVFPLSVVGIAIPRLGLYVYYWFALMRPDVLAWSYGEHSYSLILAVGTLIGASRYIVNINRLFKNPITVLLIILLVPITLSWVFAVNPSLSLPPLVDFYKMIIMVFAIPVLLSTLEDLRYFMLVLGFSLGALSVKFGLFGIIHGGVRYAAGYGGFMSENNSLGIAFALIVPICWYCQFLVKSVWIRSMYVFFVFTSLASVVWTHSRAAFIAACIAMLMIGLRSRRKAYVFVFALITFGPAVYLVQRSYVARIESIADYQDDGSAEARIRLAKMALRIWREHPVLGVGYGTQNFINVASSSSGGEVMQVAHNNYLQMAADSGTGALVVLVLLLFGSIRLMGRTAKEVGQVDENLRYYPYALEASLLTFAIVSVFASKTGYDFVYLLLGTAATWHLIQRDLLLKAALQPGEQTVDSEIAPQLASGLPQPALPNVQPAPVRSVQSRFRGGLIRTHRMSQ